jgi:phage terminase large subunit GpA-like protein
MKDPPRLQVWVNTKLGESWEDQSGEVVETEPLMARREDWGAVLPEGVAVLTAGVDVQGDRLELHVVGWGRDEESWSVDYRVIWGDPSGPRVWADLDTALAATYPHTRAVADLAIRAVAVDTGGQHTKAAYEYCRTRLHRRVWGIKGRGGPGIPLWPRRPTRTKGKVPLFVIGVDAAKDALFARLRLAAPGPGYMHFPAERDAEFFRQLTAERVVTRFERGRPIRLWQPRRDGERNEALDTTVYAMAALHGLISMGLRLNKEAESLGVSPCKGAVSAPAGPAGPAEPAKVIRSRWMG